MNTTQIAFKIEIHPVLTKTFNEVETRESVSHYMGFIHGISHLNLKNLYMTNTRREMIDQMFNTLKYAGIMPV
jgi:hypothetical protein